MSRAAVPEIKKTRITRAARRHRTFVVHNGKRNEGATPQRTVIEKQERQASARLRDRRNAAFHLSAIAPEDHVEAFVTAELERIAAHAGKARHQPAVFVYGQAFGGPYWKDDYSNSLSGILGVPAVGR